jgi:hypothetical protein
MHVLPCLQWVHFNPFSLLAGSSATVAALQVVAALMSSSTQYHATMCIAHSDLGSSNCHGYRLMDTALTDSLH